jgi:hypothetical protein
MMLSAGHDAKNFLGALRHLTASMNSDARSRDRDAMAREVSDAADLLNRTLSVMT